MAGYWWSLASSLRRKVTPLVFRYSPPIRIKVLEARDGRSVGLIIAPIPLFQIVFLTPPLVLVHVPPFGDDMGRYPVPGL
jgi:hypothetical protein